MPDCTMCGRKFAADETPVNGRCADCDQCVEDAGEYVLPLETPAASRTDWMVRAGLKPPTNREREERLGQYRNARNLRNEIARQNGQPQPGVRSVVETPIRW
jgi:hypothetical protein